MTSETARADVPETPGRPRGARRGALLSEWTKLRTLRSTYWTLLTAVVITVGYTALTSGAMAAQWDTMPEQARANVPSPLFFSLVGTQLGQLVLAVLGVLVISAEYRTGMIRSSLVAVPQRLRVLLAKTVVFIIIAFVVSEAMAFASFFVAQAFFATQGIAASLADEEVLRSVAGAGLYLTASGVFGLAVGALVRNTAGSITVAVAGLLVVPGLASQLPGEWGETVGMYMISNPGQQVMRVEGGVAASGVGPWVGYGIFWAWIAAVFVAAAIFLQRRDA